MYSKKINQNLIKISLKKSMKHFIFFTNNKNFSFAKTKKYLTNISKKVHICYFRTTPNNIFITIVEFCKNKTILTFSSKRLEINKSNAITKIFSKLLGEYLGF